MIPYTYLIGKTESIIDSYADQAPTSGVCAVYRALAGTTSKSLSKTRQYTRYPFNVLVRGNQSVTDTIGYCDDMVEALDLDQDGVIITLVTSEPQYAYTDDNGNLNYTFNVEVLL